MRLFKLRKGKYKSKYWSCQFVVGGHQYRKTTGLTNKAKAETAAMKMRDEIINGNIGILEKKPVPTLKNYLEGSFLPFVEGKQGEEEHPRLLQVWSQEAARIQGDCGGPDLRCLRGALREVHRRLRERAVGVGNQPGSPDPSQGIEARIHLEEDRSAAGHTANVGRAETDPGGDRRGGGPLSQCGRSTVARDGDDHD